jgi:hypothetical protein
MTTIARNVTVDGFMRVISALSRRRPRVKGNAIQALGLPGSDSANGSLWFVETARISASSWTRVLRPIRKSPWSSTDVNHSGEADGRSKHLQRASVGASETGAHQPRMQTAPSGRLWVSERTRTGPRCRTIAKGGPCEGIAQPHLAPPPASC